jgi:hypothetical protein
VNDFITLCLLAAFVIIGLMLLSRLMGGLGRPDYTQRGDEYPRYDDPDIDSRGSFGGSRGQRPQYDDPNIRSRGSFGRGWSPFSRRSSSGRADSPKIKSRGSFGRGGR